MSVRGAFTIWAPAVMLKLPLVVIAQVDGGCLVGCRFGVDTHTHVHPLLAQQRMYVHTDDLGDRFLYGGTLAV